MFGKVNFRQTFPKEKQNFVVISSPEIVCLNVIWLSIYSITSTCDSTQTDQPWHLPLCAHATLSCNKLQQRKAGIVLVRPSADFRPFSANFRPLWDQYKSAKITDLYMGGRPPRKGQTSPKSSQNGQFQPRECSARTIPGKVKVRVGLYVGVLSNVDFISQIKSLAFCQNLDLKNTHIFLLQCYFNLEIAFCYTQLPKSPISTVTRDIWLWPLTVSSKFDFELKFWPWHQSKVRGNKRYP